MTRSHPISEPKRKFFNLGLKIKNKGATETQKMEDNKSINRPLSSPEYLSIIQINMKEVIKKIFFCWVLNFKSFDHS